MRGKFIAIYGVNGIGKSTQVERLVETLKKEGKNVRQLKYPIYDLEPEGPFIYQYLRDSDFHEKNKLSPEEFQAMYARNRKRFQETLEGYLDQGEYVVAEDYTGTGIAWGLVDGAELGYLESINRDLLKEDVALLLDGERFLSAIEKGHKNENDSTRIRVCRSFHLLLGERYGWIPVSAEGTIEEVSLRLYQAVQNKL